MLLLLIRYYIIWDFISSYIEIPYYDFVICDLCDCNLFSAALSESTFFRFSVLLLRRQG